jgi:hypothetical protein
MENQDIIIKANLAIAGRTYVLSVPSDELPIFQQLVADINQQLTKMQATYPRYDKQDFLANLLFNKAFELYKTKSELTTYQTSSSNAADSETLSTSLPSEELDLERVYERLDIIRDLLAQSLQ